MRGHITSRLDLRLLACSAERTAALAAHKTGSVWMHLAECVPGANLVAVIKAAILG